MEQESQAASEVGASGPTDGPAGLAAGGETSQDMEVSNEQAAEAAAGASSEADADESDKATQSTFESRPSKSVADFTASGIVTTSTTAATSELEAKLRQRMLKCEGTDVIHRVTSPVIKTNSEVGNPGKADELARTAAYQRCTKVRQESVHPAGDGGEEGRRAAEGRRAGQPPGEGDGGEELDSEEGPEAAPDAAPEEQKPSSPSAAPPPPASPATAPQASSEASLKPAPQAQAPSEALLTPRSDGDGAGSGEASDFGSVVSQYEFFEPADGAPTCATFALDDPTRDAAEERSGDTRSPRLLDLEDGDADDADGAPSADLSVEECLLDLVNHIPPKIAQRIGTLFQHFESVKREGASDAPPQPPPPHADCLAYERQVEEHEEASRLRQEQLEQQLRDQAAEHSSEARVLREELEESRQRSSQLHQLPSASAEAELRETAGGELESMSAALADADSKLIDVGVRLEVTSQQSDRFRGKASTAEAELKALRLRVEEAGEQLQASEDRRDQLGVEAGDMAEAQRRLRSELEREAQARREAQDRLDLELADVSELSEATASARAQLALWSGEREEAQARLAASQRTQQALSEELACGEELQGLLRDEVAAARARSSETQEGLRRQVAEAEAAAQRRRLELEQAQAEILALQAPSAEAARLRREVAAEGAVAQGLRREAQTEEASLRAEIESCVQDMERLRQEMEAADSAHSSRSVDLLAAELASATAEKEEASRRLHLEREQLLEQRRQSFALARENEELRSGQEELQARLETQAQEMVRSTEQGARLWEVRHSELEERRAGILAEAEEVRLEKAKISAMEEEQSGMVALVQDLVRRVEEVDAALQQGKRHELRTSSELESACSERSALERDLDKERVKMSEEREMRAEAEKDAMTLANDKEMLGRRLKSAMSEADRGRKHEVYMGSELATLRRALVAEAEEMKAEIARRHHCRVESRQLQAARMELQSRLRAEEAAAALPEAPRAPAPRGAHGRRDAQVLRDELYAEREQLVDQSKRMAQLQQFRQALDAEASLPVGGAAPSAPSAASGSQKAGDTRTLQDALKRQLYRAGEATRARGDPRRAPALSEELREVEEEGKVRREQLEAETSLMAMEVVTLTKGLGGRLLESGIIGLHRNPMTAHDIRFRLGAVGRNSASATRAGGGGFSPGKLPGAAAAEGGGLRGAGSRA